MPNQVSIYENAKHWVAQYESVDEVKQYIDKAAAVEEYARRAKDYELINLAARARVRAERRCGELLQETEKRHGSRGTGSNQHKLVESNGDTPPTLNDMGLTKNQSSKFQKIADVPEDEFEDALDETKIPSSHSILKKRELKAVKKKKQAKTAANVKTNKPTVYLEDYAAFLGRFKSRSVDLLLTDPPYSTDIDDIDKFAAEWLPLALSKVKLNGRAFICIGAYPNELKAYLDVLLTQKDFILDNPLIWTYRNTLGVTPKMKYNLNYQVILHLYSERSTPLDTAITNEMFSVQDISAPDGRQGNRFHAWQKPAELSDRLIRHATTKDAVVIDPFCCTGTFLVSAAKHGRAAYGCDISRDHLDIAIGYGCALA